MESVLLLSGVVSLVVTAIVVFSLRAIAAESKKTRVLLEAQAKVLEEHRRIAAESKELLVQLAAASRR